MIYRLKNINMLRLLCIFLLAFSVHTNGKTVAPVKVKKAPLVLKMDTTQVNVRHFDSVALKTYSKQPEFQYQEDDGQSAPSWWTRFWRWFWNWLLDLFKPAKLGNHKYSQFIQVLLYILQYLAIGAGLAALVFLILKMAGIDMLNIFRRKPMGANLPYLESLENIHDINFDDELERAVAQHNYRLAVRLLYLKCLKQLSDADLIKWQIDKTNSAYINELTNPDQRRVFKTLTLQFEYTWYGEFAIDATVFKNINALFMDFKKGIV
jgi:hypothetical protein